MPNFDIANQNKVHKSILRQIGHDRLKAALANVTRDQLAQIATDIRKKNDKRNAKGLASQYFGPKQSPNGKFIMSYPKPVGKMLYLDHAAAAKDETVVWKLLRAAVKARDAEAKVAAAQKLPSILTVNVIEMNCGQPSSLQAWPETPEGNQAAEEKFKELASKAGCQADDLDAAVEDGIYEAEPTGYDILLVHSDG